MDVDPKQHEARVKELQDALVVGEQSGLPQAFDFDAFKARKRAEFEADDQPSRPRPAIFKGR